MKIEWKLTAAAVELQCVKSFSWRIWSNVPVVVHLHSDAIYGINRIFSIFAPDAAHLHDGET